jgi:hypothetical protein
MGNRLGLQGFCGRKGEAWGRGRQTSPGKPSAGVCYGPGRGRSEQLRGQVEVFLDLNLDAFHPQNWWCSATWVFSSREDLTPENALRPGLKLLFWENLLSSRAIRTSIALKSRRRGEERCWEM